MKCPFARFTFSQEASLTTPELPQKDHQQAHNLLPALKEHVHLVKRLIPRIKHGHSARNLCKLQLKFLNSLPVSCFWKQHQKIFKLFLFKVKPIWNPKNRAQNAERSQDCTLCWALKEQLVVKLTAITVTVISYGMLTWILIQDGANYENRPGLNK